VWLPQVRGSAALHEKQQHGVLLVVLGGDPLAGLSQAEAPEDECCQARVVHHRMLQEALLADLGPDLVGVTSCALQKLRDVVIDICVVFEQPAEGTVLLQSLAGCCRATLSRR
jgi:hypothetical protein